MGKVINLTEYRALARERPPSDDAGRAWRRRTGPLSAREIEHRRRMIGFLALAGRGARALRTEVGP